MNRFILSGVLALSGIGLAQAADMPVKAAPLLFDNVTSGAYIGIETGASVANEKGSGLFANNLVSGNVTAAGGVVGGCLGYIRGSASSAWGVKTCADYQNIAATGVIGQGTASRWNSTSEVQFYGNFFSWFQQTIGNLGVNIAFPTFVPPSLNGGVNLAAAPHNYFAAGVKLQGISGNFGSMNGATVGVDPMVKAGAVWQTLDASGKPNGGAIDVNAEVAFFKKGVTLANVFASAGQPTSIHTEMGTTYTGKVSYLFGIGR